LIFHENASENLFVFGNLWKTKVDFENTIPISGILGDQQAALFGQTCFQKGDIKILMALDVSFC